MASELDYATIEALLAPQNQALQALAMRPQKTSQISNVLQTTSPNALKDLLATRKQIGVSTKELNDALKAREDLGYTLASSLANIPQQQGYGSWLSDFARAFGGGMARPTDASVERAKEVYDAQMRDLVNILAFDKAMGETQGQYQQQEIGYTPMEYSGSAGAKSREEKATGGSVNGIQAGNFGRSVGYDPVKNLPEFSSITRAALSEEQVNPVLKYVGGGTLAKGIAENTASKLQSTWSDISDNILSGRVLDFVGKAGGIRVADTPAEQEFIFGPIRNYQSMTKKQLEAGLTQARNNFVASGLSKAKQAGLDITEDELKNWWNSAFSVPKGLETKTMYNIQDRPQQPAQNNTIVVGEVRNGYRFKGGDPKKKENWELAQ